MHHLMLPLDSAVLFLPPPGRGWRERGGEGREGGRGVREVRRERGNQEEKGDGVREGEKM